MNEENNNLNNGTNNSGYTVKVVLITLLVVLLIGLIGFIVYDKVIKKDDVNNKTNTEENTNQTNNDKENNNINFSDLDLLKANNGIVDDTRVSQSYYYLISNNEKIILKDLLFPYNYINTSRGFVDPIENFDVLKMSRDKKMEYVLKLLYDGGAAEVDEACYMGEDIDKCYKDSNGEVYSVYVNADTVSEMYKKLYGTIDDYKNGTINSDYPSIPSKYDEKTNKYWGLGSDGDTGFSRGTIIKKVEKLNDEIDVYVDVFYILNSSEYDGIYAGENDDNNFINNEFDTDFSKSLWKGSSENLQKAVVDLAKQNKLQTYKFTFKKQSDGKYYVYSGEWQ